MEEERGRSGDLEIAGERESGRVVSCDEVNKLL